MMTRDDFYKFVMNTPLGLSSTQLKHVLFLIKTHNIYSMTGLRRHLASLNEMAKKIGSDKYEKILRTIRA